MCDCLPVCMTDMHPHMLIVHLGLLRSEGATFSASHKMCRCSHQNYLLIWISRSTQILKKKVNRIMYILIYFYSYMIHVSINGVNRYEKKYMEKEYMEKGGLWSKHATHADVKTISSPKFKRMGQPESWGALSASNRPPQNTRKKQKQNIRNRRV